MNRLFILLALTFSMLAQGQTLTVRLLNGKSGKPIKKKSMWISWDDSFDETELFIGADGLGHIQIPQGARSLLMTPGPRSKKEPLRDAFFDCNNERVPSIDVATILEKGFVPGNTCGKKTVAAHPGEVVFWGSPLPWWLPDFQ
jgi:hypothetical protein